MATEKEVKKPEADANKLVKVVNNTGNPMRQHSTGIVIQAKSVGEVKEDGWLQNQLKAGLLALAKE